jgi:hypothetical protein
MNLKLSHSKIEKFKQCPKSYDLWYNKKIRPDYVESPLFFGTAFDEALNRMLLNKKNKDTLTKEEIKFINDYENEFDVFDKFFRTTKLNYIEDIDLKTSLRARYYKNDYNDFFLENEDIEELKSFLIKNDYGILNPKLVRNLMLDTSFDELDNNDRIFITMGYWMSLRRKGHKLLKLYKDKIYPLINEVIDIQKNVNLPETDENGKKTGRYITGKIDVRVTLNGKSGVYTIDNKTSSQKYTANAVEKSQQLGIYLEESNDKYAGYFIVIKNPKKIKIKKCLSCNKIYEKSRLQKCKKCKNELDVSEKYELEYQILLGKPDSEILEKTFDEFVNIGDDIEEKNFPPNFENKCFLFGKKCCYFNYCRSKDMTNLVNMNEFWGK